MAPDIIFSGDEICLKSPHFNQKHASGARNFSASEYLKART